MNNEKRSMFSVAGMIAALGFLPFELKRLRAKDATDEQVAEAQNAALARREREDRWIATLQVKTRQQTRRGLFLESLAQVNRRNVSKNKKGHERIDSGGNYQYALTRRQRRHLARAYAVGEWKRR